MEIYVASDLYVAGQDEEGREYFAECYYVVAELEDGSRYRKGSFAGCEVVELEDEDGYGGIAFRDVREAALAEAEALAASSKGCDVSEWDEAGAAYGSARFDEASLYDDEERAHYSAWF